MLPRATTARNGSLHLSVSLLVSGPPYPTLLGVPSPGAVSLDLGGCLGCVSLDSTSGQVYFANMHLTGLEHPVAPSGSSGNVSSIRSVADMSLPLWAFNFVRAGGQSSVHLLNVTLTLPQAEFQMLLMSVTNGAVSAPAGLQMKVRA